MKKHVWLYCCVLLAAGVLAVWLISSPPGAVQALAGEPLFRLLAGDFSGRGTAAGPGYTLSDSVGQMVTGPSSGEGYRLEGGYQVEPPENTLWQVYLPIVDRQNP